MSELKHKFSLGRHSKTAKRSVVLMILGLVVLYGVMPNLHSLFGLNLYLKFPKRWEFLLFAVLSYYLTYIFSSISYRLLAIRKLNLARLALVQLASSTLNLLLPAGIGNISINYLYLRTHQLAKTTAGLVIGINNGLGVVGNVSLLALWLSLYGVNNSLIHIVDKHYKTLIIIGTLAVLVIVILVLFLSSAVTIAKNLRRNIAAVLVRYTEYKRWHRLVGAYLCAIGQASVTASAFWFALKAFNINLAYPLVYLIYSLSALVGGFFPTPGGLGGVEASLAAGVIAVHGADTSIALSAVLGYRFVTYWLPALTGSIALFIVQKTKMIEWNS